MSDYRELFLQNVTAALIDNGFSVEQINRISDIITVNLKDYDLTKICTDIVQIDNTSEELLKLYLGTLLTEGKSEKTVYAYKRAVLRFLNSVQKPINEVNVFDIRVWLALRQQQTKKVSCENERAYLNAFFTWLYNEELIKKNPMVKVKPIKFTREIKTPFTGVDIDALRSACKTLRERAELEILLSSGIRVSELGGLNISDVNFDNLEVFVRNGKGGKQRITFMSDVAKVHLLRYLDSRTDDEEYLFITKYKTRLSKHSAENDLHKIGDRANVKNVHPHRCRRTFATSLAKKGMDISTIQTLMGHSDINTTRGYITHDNDFIKNQAKRYID